MFNFKRRLKSLEDYLGVCYSPESGIINQGVHLEADYSEIKRIRKRLEVLEKKNKIKSKHFLDD